MCVIQIDLIVAEGCPHQLFPGGSPDWSEQRVNSWANDIGEVGVRLDGNEPGRVDRVTSCKTLEPLALAGDVVDDCVKHQPEVLAQLLDICPVAQGRIDLRVVDHRETIIRGIGEEGKDVHPRDGAFQALRKYLVERLQGRLAGFPELITVGDENRVSLGEVPLT